MVASGTELLIVVTDTKKYNACNVLSCGNTGWEEEPDRAEIKKKGMTQWKKGKLGESLLVSFIFDKSKCMLMHGSGEEPIVWPLDVNGEGWLHAAA